MDNYGCIKITIPVVVVVVEQRNTEKTLLAHMWRSWRFGHYLSKNEAHLTAVPAICYDWMKDLIHRRNGFEAWPSLIDAGARSYEASDVVVFAHFDENWPLKKLTGIILDLNSGQDDYIPQGACMYWQALPHL